MIINRQQVPATITTEYEQRSCLCPATNMAQTDRLCADRSTVAGHGAGESKLRESDKDEEQSPARHMGLASVHRLYQVLA